MYQYLRGSLQECQTKSRELVALKVNRLRMSIKRGVMGTLVT